MHKYILVPLGGFKFAEAILTEAVSFFLTEKSAGVSEIINLGA